MKSWVVGCVLVVAYASFAETHEAVVIETAGAYSFTAGDAYSAITNKASDGEVKLTSTGEAVVGDAVSVEGGFDATVSGAQTVFSGGYWDFAASDLFSVVAKRALNNRLTTLTDGAQLVNVGTVNLAGSDVGNTLVLTNDSSLSAASIVMGTSAMDDQKSRIDVRDGSSLTCTGNLLLSKGQVSGTTASNRRTGNVLSVSGEDSLLTVGGTLSVGGRQDGTFGYCGGNTFEVTDGASATLAAVELTGSTSRSGRRNRLFAGRNANVSMTELSVGSASKTSDYPLSSNTVEIVDGATVAVSGAFRFGQNYNGSYPQSGGNSVLVSNATFTVGKVLTVSPSSYFFCGSHSTFILSGPSAKFTVENGISFFFTKSSQFCSFVVENGATYDFPVSGYSNTASVSNETVIVRSGATLNFPNGLTTTKTNTADPYSFHNGLIVESGASAISPDSSKHISIYGNEGYLVVDDAKASSASKMNIGSIDATVRGTNCLMRLIGSHPEVVTGNTISFRNHSKLQIDLPPGGYDAGYATTDKPLIMVNNNGLNFYDTSTLELNGAEEMMAYHTANRIRATYVLARANPVSPIDGNLEAIQATLPDGMTISIRTKSGKQELILDVKPKYGLLLMVR